MAKKELQVSAIENGTVIDHIPADKLFDVINVLGITGMDNAMTKANLFTSSSSRNLSQILMIAFFPNLLLFK